MEHAPLVHEGGDTHVDRREYLRLVRAVYRPVGYSVLLPCRSKKAPTAAVRHKSDLLVETYQVPGTAVYVYEVLKTQNPVDPLLLSLLL